MVPDHLAIVIVTFYENEGFSDTSLRDYSRNQNLGVLSSKHAGHIWKVICQLPKIVYREVEKIVQNVYRWMEQSSRNFQPFLSYRNCKAIFFLFQKMFYRIHSLGSYERILLKAFQFVSIVYFTETELSSRKHQAGTMFVIRLKTAAYQQLELDLNFSINIL